MRLHPLILSPDELDALLYFNYDQGIAVPGSTVSIPIMLGTIGVPVEEIYGLAFTIAYDALRIDPASVSITKDSGWLAHSSNGLTFIKNRKLFYFREG